MPYADKTKQRQAQAESQRRRYHAPGSTLREYYRGKTRARRRKPTREEKIAKAQALNRKAATNARYGITGEMKPRGF